VGGVANLLDRLSVANYLDSRSASRPITIPFLRDGVRQGQHQWWLLGNAWRSRTWT
jgi:hypothetical protein